MFERALPGMSDYVTYLVNADGSLGDVSDVKPFVPYKVSDDINHPRVDEETIGFERALTGTMRLSLTGIWRDNKNFVNSVAAVRAMDAHRSWRRIWGTRRRSTSGPTARSRTPTTSSGTSRASSIATPDGQLIGTADPFRRYRAFMAVLSKRYTNRWQAQISYVYSKATGNVDNTSSAQVVDASVRNAEPGARQCGGAGELHADPRVQGAGKLSDPED